MVVTLRYESILRVPILPANALLKVGVPHGANCDGRTMTLPAFDRRIIRHVNSDKLHPL